MRSTGSHAASHGMMPFSDACTDDSEMRRDAVIWSSRSTISPHYCGSGSGITIDEMLADYEDLERDDVLAALVFATRLAQAKGVELIGQ